MSFRFRLARVLEWYERKYQLESDRLRERTEHVAALLQQINAHTHATAFVSKQVFELSSLSGQDLTAHNSFRQAALNQQKRLKESFLRAERDLEAQRLTTLAAQRNLRLVEKLRQRKRHEFDYVTARQLEEIGAESYIAAWARNLAEKNAVTNSAIDL